MLSCAPLSVCGVDLAARGVCGRRHQNRPEPRYRGLIHGITVVVKEEGIMGVYRGLVPTIAKQMGNQSIRFSVYSQIKSVRRCVRSIHPCCRRAWLGEHSTTRSHHCP